MEMKWDESKNKFGKVFDCDVPYGDFILHYFVGNLSETFMVMHESINGGLIDSNRVESYEDGFQKAKEKYEARLSKINNMQNASVNDDCALINRGVHENPYNTVLASMCRLFRHFYFTLSFQDSRSQEAHAVCVKNASENLIEGLKTIDFLKKRYPQQCERFKDHFQYESSMENVIDAMDAILPYIPSTVISSEPVAMNLQDEEMIYGETSATYQRHQLLRTEVYDCLIQKCLPLENLLARMYLLLDYLMMSFQVLEVFRKVGTWD